MDYEFQIFNGEDGQVYARIVHQNGQTIFVSEGYTRRQSAIDSVTNFVRSMALYFYAGENTVANLMRASLTIEADCE
jgi:uncharacterized protein YegP (UPF0339 family)